MQVLQLVHGRHRPVRPLPHDARRAQLAVQRYIESDEAAQLDDAYRFLRPVEHRLQLQDEQQTHTLPTDRDRRRGSPASGVTAHPGTTTALDLDLACQRNQVRGDPRAAVLRAAARHAGRGGPLWPERRSKRA